MTILVLGVLLVAVTPASDRNSLGIGLDVLPQAYAVAANHVRAPAELQLSTCTTKGCRWDLGEGVEIVAQASGGGIGIDKLSASWTPEGASVASMRFEKACLTIVALIDADGTTDDRLTTAEAIASFKGSGIDIERPDIGVTFYGLSSAKRAGTAAALQCGAMVETIDGAALP